jgi:hypothetical protein
MKKTETPDMFLSIENETLICSYKQRLDMNLDIAKRIVQARIEFTQGESYPILIDFSHLKSATKEARDYMNDPDGGLKGLVGGAFLSNSVVATVFINLYLKINKPIIPSKFFTEKAEALNWLQELKKH